MAKAKYTRRSDGRWGTTVWDGTYTDTGKKRRVPIYSSKSSRDLEKKVNEYNQAREAGQIISKTNQTVYDYASEWVIRAKSSREDGTLSVYQNLIDTHLAEYGYIGFEDFTHSFMQYIVNQTKDRPQTCNMLVMTCKQIVKAAEKDHLLPRGSYLDIFDDLDIPRYEPKERRPLTPTEKKLLTTASFTPREKMFLMLIYGTGFRRGEALALTVFDISFRDKTIRVDKSLAFHRDGHPYIKKPKTKNSYRTNPIPDWLLEELRRYIDEMNLSSNSYLFTKKDNGLMTRNAYETMWGHIKKVMTRSYLSELSPAQARLVNWKEIGIQDLTAHVFRHNYCTALCYQMIRNRNISIKKIARLMGDTEKMIMEVYSHIIEELENAEEAIEAAVNL